MKSGNSLESITFQTHWKLLIPDGYFGEIVTQQKLLNFQRNLTEIEKRAVIEPQDKLVIHFHLANHPTFLWKFHIFDEVNYTWNSVGSHRFSLALRFGAYKCSVRCSISCDSTKKVFSLFFQSNNLYIKVEQNLHHQCWTDRCSGTAEGKAIFTINCSINHFSSFRDENQSLSF